MTWHFFFCYARISSVCVSCVVMDAAEGPSGSSVLARRLQTFAYMVAQSPQPLPMVDVPLRPAKVIASEHCVLFSKEEIDQFAVPFKFSMVLKFLQQRPTLDVIR